MIPLSLESKEDLAVALLALPAEIEAAAELVKLRPTDELACRHWAELCELKHQAVRAVKEWKVEG